MKYGQLILPAGALLKKSAAGKALAVATTGVVKLHPNPESVYKNYK